MRGDDRVEGAEFVDQVVGQLEGCGHPPTVTPLFEGLLTGRIEAKPVEGVEGGLGVGHEGVGVRPQPFQVIELLAGVTSRPL
jgi:hypothetical protein